MRVLHFSGSSFLISNFQCICSIFVKILQRSVIYFTENMIYKGLDDEEASFLNTVVNEQTKQMKERLERERAELSAYRV